MMRQLTILVIIVISLSQGCIIDDDYGKPGSFDDLGELLADDHVARFIWSPASNELVYISQPGQYNHTVKAVNIETKEKRIIANYNAAIDEIAWKNDNYQELLVSFRLEGNVTNSLELIDLSANTKQTILNNNSGRSFFYWPDIISNQKFLATRTYNSSTGVNNLYIRNWNTNETVLLGNLHPLAASPDFEQVILVDNSLWPHQYYLYAIETEDLFLLSGFDNFPANYIEWTEAGTIAYIIQPSVYIWRNLGSFNTIRYDLTNQYDLLIKGTKSGNSFLFLYQQCRNGGPVYDCSIGVTSEIFVREVNQAEGVRVMLTEKFQFTEASFSPDEKAIAAVVANNLYYKKFKE